MTPPPSPDRLALAARLRELRERTGLTSRALAETLNVDQSRVSRVETGVLLPRQEETVRLLDLADATETEREQVLADVERVRTEAVAYRRELPRGRGRKQQVVGSREQAAGRIRVYQIAVVPGMLQTEEYMRRMFQVADEHNLHDHDEAVAARLDRQRLLYEPGREWEYLIDERALWWVPGGDVGMMLGQLDRLIVATTLGQVTVGVLPLGSVPIFTPSGWEILDRMSDEGDPVVSVETLGRELLERGEEEVAIYGRRHEELRAAALVGSDARRALGGIADRMRRGQEDADG